MRQIAFDTETTGLDTSDGHRIIEIGGVEIINRRLTGKHFHYFLQPDREIDQGAIEVHGITNDFLKDKPRFTDIVDEFLDYIRDAELIIHNASFDIGFIDYELSLLGIRERATDFCTVFDTLSYSRRLHPGQRNSLDALCKRYHIDNAQRTLHGALLDAELLADVYLAITGGQVALSLENKSATDTNASKIAEDGQRPRKLALDRPPLIILRANDKERASHASYLESLQISSGGRCVWMGLEQQR
jgi:DNA polymerase-3 subunit epsilon